MITPIWPLLDDVTNPVIALSCGVDSLAAAHFLGRFFLGKGIQLRAWHHNHNLRPQNDTMAAKAILFCDEHHLPLTLTKRTGEAANATEGHLRNGRLEAFGERFENSTLITAHHLDDFVESAILNFIRGKEDHFPIPLETHLENGNRIIHPFLNTEKKDFERRVDRFALETFLVKDETNEVTSGSRRNLIRKEIVPILERERIGMKKIYRKKLLQRVRALYSSK